MNDATNAVPAEANVAPTPESVDTLSDAQLDAAFEQMSNEPEAQAGEAPAPAENEAGVHSDAGEVAEAPQADPQEETADAQAPAKTVPLAALHEERAKRKELKAQMDRMEGRFQQMVEGMRKPAEEQPKGAEIPSLEDSPVEHFDARLAQIEKYRQELEIERAKGAQASQQEAEWNKVLSTYSNDAARFSQTQQDFGDAYNYWQGGRQAELQAGGATPEQAAHIVQQEEAAAVVRALQEGESPAERVYAIAKARGYTPAPVAPAAPAGGPDPDVIAKGQTQAGGMPAGGNTPAELSLEALATMNDEDFEKNWGKIVGHQ
jgi:hypothetical protein